ncbi:MAG: His/Gly/Thr/Pro-type tRNA ligase C-terminal domain-containing protein, partial [Candidatus Dormibacteraceae bacterium]
YYTRTVFEFQRADDEGAQSALGGGGRYDGLSAALGFADTPGSGFAMGLERIIATLPGELGGEPRRPSLDLLVLIEEGVASGAGAEVARRARQRVAAAADASPRSLKAKMRSASRAGVRWVALIAAGDVEGRRLRLRDMVSGEQRELGWDQLPEVLG